MIRARGAVPPGCTAASSISRIARAVWMLKIGRPAAGIPVFTSETGARSPSRANTVYARASCSRLTENAVPVRHRRLLDRPPRLRFAQLAGRSPGNPSRGGAPNPTRWNRSCISSRGSESAIFAAPTLDDFWMTCAAVSRPDGCASWIVKRAIVSVPGAVWICVCGVTRPSSIASATGERLQRRARLEEVGDDAIAQLRAAQLRAVVRVVRRDVREREDLARAYIERDERTRLRLVGFDRALQR
jgi:hypothetical protein